MPNSLSCFHIYTICRRNHFHIRKYVFNLSCFICIILRNRGRFPFGRTKKKIKYKQKHRKTKPQILAKLSSSHVKTSAHYVVSDRPLFLWKLLVFTLLPFLSVIGELINRRLLHDDAVGLRDMSTAHAYLGTCQRRLSQSRRRWWERFAGVLETGGREVIFQSFLQPRSQGLSSSPWERGWVFSGHLILELSGRNTRP